MVFMCKNNRVKPTIQDVVYKRFLKYCRVLASKHKDIELPDWKLGNVYTYKFLSSFS